MLKMKIKIGKYTYRKASDLLIVLSRPPKNERDLKLFCFIIGIYSCRLFGIVRYKTKTGFDTDKIGIGVSLNECRTDQVS